MPAENDAEETATTETGADDKGAGGTSGGGGDDVEALRAQVQTLSQQFNETQTRYKALETNYNKAQQELRKTKEKHKNTPEGKEDFEAHVREEYEGKYSGELADLRGQVAQKEQTIKKLLITNTAKSYAAKYFQPDIADLIVREVEQQCDLDGEEIVIKDSAGTIRKSGNAKGQKLSLDELFQELTAKYPSATSPKIRSGTMPNHERVNGSGNGTSEVKLPAGFGTWNEKQKTEWFAKNPEARKAFIAGWRADQ